MSEWQPELNYTPHPSDWLIDQLSGSIMAPSAKGGFRTVLDLRGWGYLTGKGHGALSLPAETAAAEQDALARFIIEACREKAERDTAKPE